MASYFDYLSVRHDVLVRNLIINKFKFKPKMTKHAFLAALITGVFVPFYVAENVYYACKIKREKVKVEKPVFVLGHWRTGTTLLVNYLSRDPQFSFLDPLKAVSINTFLIGKTLSSQAQKELFSKMRTYDNMEYKVGLPYEEYVAFAFRYPYSTWTMNHFPQAKDYYINFAFVDELPEKRKKDWLKHYDKLLKRMVLKCGDRLLLKSPDATARSLLLKTQYPDAKFVNIYRDPYVTVRSTINLYQKMFDSYGMQETPSYEELEDFVISTFKRMYLKFFEDIKHIPDEDFIEFRFEDFELDPLTCLKAAYDKFGWDYEKTKDYFSSYKQSLVGYKKNEFDYKESLIKKVNAELGFYFEHYGYTKREI